MVPEGQMCQSRRSMKEDVRRRGQNVGTDDAFTCWWMWRQLHVSSDLQEAAYDSFNGINR